MKIIALPVAFMLFSACSRTFPPFEGTTRVDVRTNLDSLASITDSAAIAGLVAFVNDHRRGWGQPWAGVPVPDLGVVLYRGTQVQGSFYVGTNFFAAQREGDFFSRNADRADVAAFRRLLQPYTAAPSRDSTLSPNER
jgi:hypothetical protein